jgi:putative hydrolases of HD superfamily
MLQKPLIMRLFNAFTIQRWTDQIRPVPLVEMDKHGHKMAIAYCIARYAQQDGQVVHWNNLIQGGMFELLRRTVLSDIKSPIYRKLRTEHAPIFRQLSQWVYDQLEDEIANDALLKDLKAYLITENLLDPLSKSILNASHTYSSYWEFQIIRETTPNTEASRRIENTMLLDLAPYYSLGGLKRLLEREPVAGFVDRIGQLRFQVRWGQTHRLPVTSVLGHSMMVAALAYFLTRALSPPPCNERLRNNFFGGLFHDLPETVTRDIVSPVKRAVPELPEILSKIEKELVYKEIYPLLDESWHEEFRYFTEDEFSSKVFKDGQAAKVSSEEIARQYNADEFRPIDGELIQVADGLAAFVEAHKSIEAGVSSPELLDGRESQKNKYKNKKLAGLNIGSIYKNF